MRVKGIGNDLARCPRCGGDASGYTALLGETPKENDIVICAYCAGVNVYRADLTLRVPSPSEMPDIIATLISIGLGSMAGQSGGKH